MLFSCTRTTPRGSFAVIWSYHRGRPKIIRILLSGPGSSARRKLADRFPGAKASSHPHIGRIVDRIEGYLSGKETRLSPANLRLDLCSAFQREVLLAAYAVPRGNVSTYGLIAKHIGSPGAARAVGTALTANPFPIIIPCHRIIRSDGSLGGYQNGLGMKKALLGIEGVRLRNADRASFDMRGVMV